MKIDLPYDDSSISMAVPDGVRVEGEKFPPPLADLREAFTRAIERPEGSKPLFEMIPEAGRISVLISDMTRGGQVRPLIEHLLEFLENKGVTRDRIEIFISTGMHRGQSLPEIRERLGEAVTQRFRIVQHDASDERSLISTGVTGAGTECLFNERVVDSSLVIGLGQISFHYFAGFGGSRKLILPGVAGESTILQNHRLSLMHDPGEGLHENCQPGKLQGNPVHEDMLEGARTLPAPVFMINLVAGSGTVPAFLNGGDMERSHLLAVDWFRSRFTFAIDEPYKAVVAAGGGTPKDLDLLQSHKAIRYASSAVDQGGLLLMAAACREGSGSTSLEECFKKGRDGVPGTVRAGYTLNSQTAMSIFDLTCRMSIYLRSRLEDRQASAFGFIPWEDGFEDYLLEGIGPEEILVVKNAANFLPVRTG